MVGLFHLGLLLILSLSVSCAQLAEIEADPSFWPGAKHRLRRVPASVVTKSSATPIAFKKAPSLAHSEWTLLSKSSFSQREYKLVLRDEKDNLMDSPVAPDMILEGDALLHSVTKISPATWSVRLEFIGDQSVVKVGFSIGGQRLGHFRQIHFNLHEIDVFATHSYALKTKVRADGKDHLRVYVSLRDQKNYAIYSYEDFDLKLNLSSKNAIVEGPFSTSTGPYFKIVAKKPAKIDYHLSVDGERVSGAGQVEFIPSERRGPAAEVGDCLKDMSVLSGVKVASNMDPVDAYRELAQALIRRYEEIRDVTPDSLARAMESLSPDSCTANSIWDGARDDAGRSLHTIHQRLSR